MYERTYRGVGNEPDQQWLIVNCDYFQLSLFTPYSWKATFSAFLNFLNFILFYLKFIKFELHNYAPQRAATTKQNNLSL